MFLPPRVLFDFLCTNVYSLSPFLYARSEGGDEETPESAPAETKAVVALQEEAASTGEEEESCIYTTDGRGFHSSTFPAHLKHFLWDTLGGCRVSEIENGSG